MDNQRHSISYTAMMFGLYLGLALILESVIFYVFGKPFSDISGYLSYAIIIGLLGYTMWSYAKANPEAGMSYGQAVGLGTLITLYSSIIFAFFQFILYKYIDPSLFDQFLAVLEEKMLSQGQSEEQVEKFMEIYSKIMSPTILGFSQIFSLTLMGLIFSLILSIFLKKNPENPFYEVEDDDE